jgi:serine/threonine protein phosphatase PrpC
VAAREAAAAAGGAIGRGLGEPATELEAVAEGAVAAAQAAVADVPWTTRAGRETPSCTLVAAVCRDREIVVASVGDSRAYWAGAEGVRQLSLDDSWAQEQIDEGRLSVAEAHRDARSHSITHWIGADAPGRPPRLARCTTSGPGRLVLCSDGLWNYLASADHLGGLLDALPSAASPAAVARALTEFALARGGRDNITVAVIDIA